MRIPLLLIVALKLGFICGVLAQSEKPPIAKREPKEIVTHGDRRVDDYFWLRDKTNQNVISYLEAENTYADAFLRPTAPLQEKLYKEMLGYLKEDDSSAPLKLGEFFYYHRTEKGKNYRIHCRKKGSLSAPEEIVLNENELAKGHEFFSVGIFAPSDDNNILAYSTDTTGYRQYTLRFKDLRTGKILPDTAERVQSFAWAPDNKTVYFTTEHAVTKRNDEAYRLTLGQKPEKLFSEPDELFDVWLTRSKDREYIFVVSESKLSTEARFLPLQNRPAALTVLQPRSAEHKYFPEHRKGRFVIRTNDKAKNYRIVTAPVDRADKDHWEELVPHNPDVKIDDHEVFAEHLVLAEREGGLERLRIFDAKLQSHIVSLPEPAYSLALDQNPNHQTAKLRFQYESFVTPDSVFEYDMNTRERTLLKALEVPGYDSGKYTSERIFATASDGVRIPCSVVYKRGVKLDGTAPLMLIGYGSYGYPHPVSFNFSRLPALDRGVIYVVAHIRGGGELGELWREAGRMMQKRTTFTDFIACADHLIKAKYTSSDRLAIQGGSAGGLLMGAVINQRPDLFRAVVAYVPFVDVLNTMLDATLPLTTSEYIEWGNPNEKPAYDYMKTYSPYDNVKAQAYPAMLVRASYNDSQVPYWEAAKWVARLRALKTDKNALLLKTNMGAGHGGASGRYDHLKDVAYDMAFVLTQIGAEPRP
ncbi:MAG TPA: S9 family peptidase [Methylomirabilota bacterium]|nr:S9 family peptidase [Methylomirabilota bacterium]